MNTMIRSAFRLNNLRPLLKTFKTQNLTNLIQQREITRNLWCMCISKKESHKIVLELNKHNLCSCGCGKHKIHSKAEKELVQYLTEEISAERKARKLNTIPTEIDGFNAQLNGSKITLTKKTNEELIKITFNVNHTVDTDIDPETYANAPESQMDEISELKSKPPFKIDLLRGATTITLICSFIGPDDYDSHNDIFRVDEVSIFNGDWNENVYSVSDEVMDLQLYNLLMNYVHEKGITNEFVEKLSAYSTAYEHSAYIGLLEGLSKFASGK